MQACEKKDQARFSLLDDFFINFEYEVACNSCDYCCAPYCIDHLIKSESDIIDDIIVDMVTDQNDVIISENPLLPPTTQNRIDETNTDTVTIIEGQTARSFSSITDAIMEDVQNPDEPFSSSGSGGYDNSLEYMTETDDEELISGTKTPPRAEYLTPLFVSANETDRNIQGKVKKNVMVSIILVKNSYL